MFVGFGCALSSLFMTLSSFVQVHSSISMLEPLAMDVFARTQFKENNSNSSCALLFFGLPRSYEMIVLPSIVRHVLQPNKHCDVYAHAIVRHEEAAGRSGRGGAIDPNALFLLKDKVVDAHVAIETETEDEFYQLRNATLHKYRTTKDKNGNLLYYPYKLLNFNPETVDNILKQWHSIESVWNLMEQHEAQLGKTYQTVGMFRSDVFFATPISLSQRQSQEAVTPGFALYPVNDRMIYGSKQAVQIWAKNRFQRFENNVEKMPPGHGMHSERFLDLIVFPAIRNETSTKITEDKRICFFRVRADESIWVNDCLRAMTRNGGTNRNPRWVAQQKKKVEEILGRKCKIQPLTRLVNQLLCPSKRK